nr:MAG TPA: hypothetical protein [Caudoviricetes sp.]DAJ41203.1 MAG TPA: hypothetical protein [Caudoviricetes sp.]
MQKMQIGLFFVFENALCVFETRKSVVRKEET